MRLMPAEAHPELSPFGSRRGLPGGIRTVRGVGTAFLEGADVEQDHVRRHPDAAVPARPDRMDSASSIRERRRSLGWTRVPSRPDAAPHVGRDRRRAGWLATPCLRGRSGTAPARRETTGDLDARAHAGAPSGSDGLPSLCPPRSEAPAPCRTLSRGQAAAVPEPIRGAPQRSFACLLAS